MKEEIFESVISRIQYKPGYALTAKDKGHGFWEVLWTFTRPDRNRIHEFEIGQSGSVIVHLPSIVSIEGLVRQIFAMTVRLEEHEAREFFQYDHRRPFDPHKALL